MKLYSETSGDGPGLVLIHGWGLHGGIWDALLPWLEPHFRVTRVDLPGHGRSDWPGSIDLDGMVEAVSVSVPTAASWAGWSLGGLVAVRAGVLAVTNITALVLIATSPCFIRKPDWQPAMLPSLLDTFAVELQKDYTRTLNRFLSLQVRGSQDAGRVLRQLRAGLLAHGQPSSAGLQAGLEILRTADLRESLAAIACPTLLLMGERDSLVPLSAGEQTAQRIAGARLEVIEGAGHAPFIARPETVAEAITDFSRFLPAPQSGIRHA